MFSAGPRVRIVVSDADPAFGRLGRELAARLPGVELGDTADPQADINYYIPLSGRFAPVSTREMGWVQAGGPDQGAQGVDLVICPDATVRTGLVQAGLEKVTVIPPGLGGEVVEADLIIGVVGQVADLPAAQMPGITWRSVGTDAGQDSPDICRAVDYLLVPGLSPAGLSLACIARAVGTPVIACDVAELRALAQSVFRTGDGQDLRRAVRDCLAAAQVQRHGAQEQSWVIFAEAHNRAFAALDMPALSNGAVQEHAGFAGPVRLVLHGDEHKALGGPSVRAPRTAAALRAQGVAAQAGVYTAGDDIDAPMVHLFNVWSPESALQALEHLKAAGKRVILSPIYLDLRAHGFWQAQLPVLPLEDLEAYAATYQEALEHLEGRDRLSELVPGYHAMVRAMLDMADHVIFLSQAERDALEEIGARVEDSRASLIPNPVDADLWQTGDPALFRETYLKDMPAAQDYVLCVGRIEPRKNQLLLARAMRDLPLRLVLVGHEGDPAYAERVRREAGPDLLSVDRLDAGGEMLRSAVAGARVFCLPSWAEGASLAALEAAAAGVQMVLGNRSAEIAYFADLADYCDVGDPRSIAAAISTCLERPAGEVASRRQALQSRVAQAYSWQTHAAATAQAYARTAGGPVRAVAPALSGLSVPAVRGRLVLDLTALAHGGAASGCAGVEAALVAALGDIAADVDFICWSGGQAGFVDLPARAAAPVIAARYCAQMGQTAPACLTLDCTLVIVSDFWRQDARYLSDLADLKARSGCAVVPLFHDLDPLVFPFRYDGADAASFHHLFNGLARLADGFLPVSQATARRTRQAVAPLLADPPPVTPLRLGDPVLETAQEGAPGTLQRTFGTRRYVLAAGPVEARANLDMLLRVWARFADRGQHEDLHLVIAGDVAPCARHIPERIARDPRLAQRVHLMGRLEARDLDWLTRSCLFTVFAAHDTDRAVPVLQSLALAKPCLASTAGAVPEIAGDHVVMIDPEDFTAWHSQISLYAESAPLRHARSSAVAQAHQAVPWADTARALVEMIQSPRAVRGPVPVFAGAPVGAGTQGGVMQAFFGQGWHPRESWGRWAAAASCDVTLNLSRQVSDTPERVAVMMHLKLCRGGLRGQQLTVRAGARVLFALPVCGDPEAEDQMPCDIIVQVPLEALDAGGCVTLTLELPPVWESAGRRWLGVGLEAIVVLDPVLCNPLQSLRAPDLWSVGDTAVLMGMSDPAHRAALCAAGPVGPQDFSAAWGLGGKAGRCDVLVPVLTDAGAQTLWITCRPVATPEHPVSAMFYWNARCISQAIWDSDRTVRIEIALSAQDLALQAPHVLSVCSDSVLMPVDLGLGHEHRIAGVGVFEIELAPEVQTGCA